MTQAALKAAATGRSNAVATAPKRANTIAGLMSDPSIKAQMALALPKHMTAERLMRIALTEVRKAPKLASCDQASFLGAIMQCAQLGLEPGGALGHAYLLPFDNKKQGRTDVQFIIGYRGMIDLARRSGQILSIEARVVYAADKFTVRFGLDSSLEHEPDLENANRGAMRFVYAVAKLKDGGTQFEVMSRAEIEKVRAMSKAGSSGPWVSHYEEMSKKTVIRRLFKYLPVSIEMQSAVGLDEQQEAGIAQDNPLIIDSETGEIDPPYEADQEEHPSSAQAHQGMGFAQVADLIVKAADTDTLDMARGFIEAVDGADLQAELHQKAAQRFAQINQTA